MRGLIWSFKSYLEHKLKIATNRPHPILAWLPTYVADVLSRHRAGLDGRTDEKKRTGKDWRRPAIQFGKLIYVDVTMPKAERQARGSHEQTTKEGRYIGHHGRTGALLVMTAEGILRGSCARRMPGIEMVNKRLG